MIKKNENKTICAACGGKCCKKIPGINHSNDFDLKNGISGLVDALNTGNWAIDWWEGDPRKNIDDKSRLEQVYYIRPATKDAIGKLYDPSWGGECVFLTERGCSLPYEKRPKTCKYLEPSPDFECVDIHGFSKEKAVISWIPFQKKIEEAARKSNYDKEKEA